MRNRSSCSSSELFRVPKYHRHQKPPEREREKSRSSNVINTLGRILVEKIVFFLLFGVGDFPSVVFMSYEPQIKRDPRKAPCLCAVFTVSTLLSFWKLQRSGLPMGSHQMQAPSLLFYPLISIQVAQCNALMCISRSKASVYTYKWRFICLFVTN